jgi:hypothetical protein
MFFVGHVRWLTKNLTFFVGLEAHEKHVGPETTPASTFFVGLVLAHEKPHFFRRGLLRLTKNLMFFVGL